MKLKLLIFLICAASIVTGQTIQRWPDKRNEVENKELPFTQNTNVFHDYGWTHPDLKGLPLTLNSGRGEWQFKSQSYKITIENDLLKLTCPDGKEIEAKKRKSHGDYYYNLAELKMKPVMQQRWVAQTTYRSEMVQTPQTRMVTSYVSDGKGGSHAVYSSQTYFSYSTRQVPMTTQRWESYTTYVPDIPAYDIFLVDWRKYEPGYLRGAD